MKNGTNMRDEAFRIVFRLREAGFEAYIVGGAVRDMVMGLEPKDWDIAADASPDDVERLFERVHRVGAQFGVCLVVSGGVSYEVAMFRKDGAYEDGRRPVRVERADPRADVLRRDFTMNALIKIFIHRFVCYHIHGSPSFVFLLVMLSKILQQALVLQ